MDNKSVFVTVGTTEFDQLIEFASSPDVCKALRQLGYGRVLLQTGRGQFRPEERALSDRSPAVQCYRFKDSIAQDIADAHLVISHAGAGSVLESMAAGKQTVVVVNELLMGNHQVELAKRLQTLSHLYYCTCSTLRETLLTSDFTSLQPFPAGDSTLLVSHLDSLVRDLPADRSAPTRLALSCGAVVAVLGSLAACCPGLLTFGIFPLVGLLGLFLFRSPDKLT